MAAGTDFFLYNTASNWARGKAYGLNIGGGTLYSSKSEHDAASLYFSLSHDSQAKDTVWHRISFDYVLPAECFFHVSFYASNEKTIVINGTVTDLDEFIRSDSHSAVEKQSLLAGFFSKPVRNREVMPLFSAKGRYLWFCIEIFAKAEAEPSVKRLKIEYPLYTFADYLPAFYRRNEQESDFLVRFISVFQDIFLSVEERADLFSRFLEPDAAKGEWLDWLSEWLSVDEPGAWTEEQLRELIKNAYGLYKLKGTKEGLRRIVTLFTGKPPMIVENYRIMERIKGTEYESDYREIFNSSIYAFTLFLDEKDLVTEQQLLALERIVEHFKPVHTLAQIVVLRPDIVLGGHFYLGINTRLPKRTGFMLDGMAALPAGTLIT